MPNEKKHILTNKENGVLKFALASYQDKISSLAGLIDSRVGDTETINTYIWKLSG